MSLQQYIDQLQAAIAHLSTTSFVINTTLHTDLRAGDQAFVQGTVHFTDNSSLHFKEYLDAVSDQVDKLMYSYHYQDAQKQLIFRYDNAAHKPPIAFTEHKHLSDCVEAAPAPTLDAVFKEILATWP